MGQSKHLPNGCSKPFLLLRLWGGRINNDILYKNARRVWEAAHLKAYKLLESYSTLDRRIYPGGQVWHFGAADDQLLIFTVINQRPGRVLCAANVALFVRLHNLLLERLWKQNTCHHSAFTEGDHREQSAASGKRLPGSALCRTFKGWIAPRLCCVHTTKVLIFFFFQSSCVQMWGHSVNRLDSSTESKHFSEASQNISFMVLYWASTLEGILCSCGCTFLCLV